MNNEDIYLKIAEEIEVILSKNSNLFSQSLLFYSDPNKKLLEALYDTLTNYENTKEAKFKENKKLYRWKKNDRIAVCYITEDIPKSKYRYLQGYAVKIRDVSRGSKFSVLFIGTPTMLSLDSFTTAGFYLSKTILSREKILQSMINSLKGDIGNFKKFLEKYLSEKPESFIYEHFEQIFEFLYIVRETPTKDKFAESLPLIGLIKDDELSFNNFFVKAEEYLKINKEISEKTIRALERGSCVFDVFKEYCDEDIANKIDTWVRFHATKDSIIDIFRMWPKEFYLSKIVERPKEKDEKEDLKIYSVELNKDFHSEAKYIFTDTENRDIYSIKENELSLIVKLNRPLKEKEVMLFKINGHSLRKKLIVPIGTNPIKLSIPKENWVEGLNYISIEYKQTKRSRVKLSCDYPFYYNTTNQNWELYEINRNLRSGNVFYIPSQVDSIVLVIKGDMLNDFKLQLDREEERPLEYAADNAINRINISLEDLEEEGTILVQTNYRTIPIRYKVEQSDADTDELESIFEIALKEEFGGLIKNIKLGSNYLEILDNTTELFCGSILNGASFIGNHIIVTGTKTKKTYLVKYNPSLFQLVQCMLDKRVEDPFPGLLNVTANNLTISGIPQDINEAWDLDRINIIKETEVYKDFMKCRRELFYIFKTMIRKHNLPLMWINLIQYKDLIINYVRQYLKLLLDKENIDKLKKTILAYRSVILFFDAIFIKNDDNDPYLVLLSPLHPVMLLNLLVKQLEFYNHFSDENKENKLSQYDINTFCRAIVPPLLSIGYSSPGGNDLQDTAFLHVSAKYPDWSIYIHLKEQCKGYEQTSNLIIKNLIDDIIDFTKLDQGIDRVKIIEEKLRNYLISHPYLLKPNNTINITYINPGTGKDLLDALLRLNRRKAFSEVALKYNIYLLSRDNIPSSELGRSFVEFSSIQTPTDFQAKMMNSISYIITNMSPSKKPNLKDPNKAFKYLPYSHITFVSGIFNDSTRVSITKASEHVASITKWYGYVDTKFDVVQKRFFRALFSQSISYNDVNQLKKLDDIFSALIHTLNNFSASLHYPFDPNNLLALETNIEPEMRKIINHIHRNADWVCFIDKSLGVELFDSAIGNQIEYLIDFSFPIENNLFTTNIIVTTQQIDYISSMIQSKLKLLCQHPIEKKSTINKLLSSINYLAGSWALQALRDEYTQLTGKLGELLALLDLTRNVTDMVKIKDNEISEIKIIVSIRDEIHKWINDDVIKLSKYSDDLAEILIQYNHNEVFINIIPIEVKNGKSASNRSVILEAREQLEGTYRLLKRRFERFVTSDSNLREIELAKFVEKNVLRFFRYFHTSYLHEIKDFLKNVIENILNKNYVLQIGYLENDRIVYGKIYCYDPEVFDQIEAEKDTGVFIYGFKRIAELLDLSEAIEKETVKTKSEKLIVESVADIVSSTDKIAILDTKGYQPFTESTFDQLETENINPIFEPEIILGTISEDLAQEWGIIGRYQGKNIAINLHHPLTIVIIGAKGSGKSYTTGVIIEASQNIPSSLNKIESKLQTIIFHYSHDLTYEPEYISLVDENSNVLEVDKLLNQYNSQPGKLNKIKVFVTPTTYKFNKDRYSDPRIELYPLFFDPDDLGIDDWSMLLYSDANLSLYIQYLRAILSTLYYNQQLSGENLIEAIKTSEFLDERQKKLAIGRIENFALKYISKENHAFKYVTKGDVIIIDIRDPMIDEDTAMALFIIFSKIASKKGSGNKLLVFDEAHKYFTSKMKNYIVALNREIRHRGVSLVISSQDPKSIDESIIELSEIVILHKLVAPDWLKHLQKRIGVLNTVSIEELSSLQKGEAYVWAKECTRLDFTSGARKIEIRPRATKHGGQSISNVP